LCWYKSHELFINDSKNEEKLMMYSKSSISRMFKTSLVAIMLSITSVCMAIEVPWQDFPITFSQQVDDYIPPMQADYIKNKLTKAYQISQMQAFYRHYYESHEHGLSPWSAQFVEDFLPMVKQHECEVITRFDNRLQNKEHQHYALNFKLHEVNWWQALEYNMALNNVSSAIFEPQNRAIAVVNTLVRALPDSAPDFFDMQLPGQGFPFDNLQESAVWMATPLYVVSVSADKAWSLVITPDSYFGWVKSADIAYVSSSFIEQWQTAAQKALVAVMQTKAPILTAQNTFQAYGYIGTVFPLSGQHESYTEVLLPIKTASGDAHITTALIKHTAVATMPVKASAQNIARLIKQLQNRPYGWGGQWFFNDCSQELKSLFTPFGIWLPRNSSAQAKLASIDLSDMTPDERLKALKSQAHPLLTIIYINGHVMLYVGLKNDNKHTAMTYQNVWGLASSARDKRYVIGQSLFLPLLKNYPEAPEAVSLLDKPTLKLIYLDELSV
tara:strand:+ start:4255 stop:5748 length:1494 start_codon:yes stop_codon:yes gene_type:complete